MGACLESFFVFFFRLATKGVPGRLGGGKSGHLGGHLGGLGCLFVPLGSFWVRVGDIMGPWEEIGGHHGHFDDIWDEIWGPLGMPWGPVGSERHLK